MKIMDKKVLHKRFGIGSIIGLKGNKIYVSFGKIFGDKMFAYPEVFAEDMKMMDADLQEEILEEAAGFLPAETAEKAGQQRPEGSER